MVNSSSQVRSMEAAKTSRAGSKRWFTRIRKSVHSAIDEGLKVEIVESRFQDLYKRYTTVQEKHEVYASYLTEESEGSETIDDQFITNVMEEFEETEKKRCAYISSIGSESDKEKEGSERMKQLRELEGIILMNSIGNLAKLVEAGGIAADTMKRALDEVQEQFT